MERLLKYFILLLTTVSTFGATGSWNGIAFTAWNSVAQTSWNGTSISCSGGAGPSWIDVMLPTDGTSTLASDASQYLFQKITFPTAGTVTKLRVYSSQDVSGGHLKIALYDGSKNLLQSGVATWPQNLSGQYTEVTITSQSVSASLYYIGWSCDNSLQSYPRRAAASGNSIIDFSGNYSGFPPNPIPGTGVDISFDFVVSAYLTP